MRKVSLFVLAAVAALLVAGCNSGASTPGVIQQDVRTINGDLHRLQEAEPLPALKDSGALRNIDYNYTAEADPNKIWYLVTQGMNGNPTGYYTIRGPVVDQSAQVTNSTQQVCSGGSNGVKNCDVIDLAEPDGVYQAGSGGQGEYEAVLTDGALLRWAGFYTVSDQPFKLVQTPSLQIDETKTISSTDTSKTVRGVVPKHQTVTTP